jgi:hypothetical protein
LSQVAFSIIHPVVSAVERGSGGKIPIAGIVAGENEFSRSAITQDKSGSV